MDGTPVQGPPIRSLALFSPHPSQPRDRATLHYKAAPASHTELCFVCVFITSSLLLRLQQHHLQNIFLPRRRQRRRPPSSSRLAPRLAETHTRSPTSSLLTHVLANRLKPSPRPQLQLARVLGRDSGECAQSCSANSLDSLDGNAAYDVDCPVAIFLLHSARHNLALIKHHVPIYKITFMEL